MSSTTTAASQPSAVAALVERLAGFEGAPEAFLPALLAGQCELSGAAGAAVYRRHAEGRAELLALVPPVPRNQQPPPWLAQAAELVAAHTDKPHDEQLRPLRPASQLYGHPDEAHLLLLPMPKRQGAAVYLLRTADPAQLDRARRELALSLRLLDLYEARLTLRHRQGELRTLASAVQVLASVNEHPRFKPAAIALCNEVADRWRAQRVSLGLLAGRYVKLRAMSHTERIDRKMKLVQHLESAMEECLDQDLEVLHPPPTEAPEGSAEAAEATAVSRAAGELARHHGPASVCSLPLRQAGEVAGVLTVEREPDDPFTAEEVAFLRLTCDLCTPRLLERAEQDRWIGARAATQTKRGLAALVGPRHTWAKVTAVAVLAAVLFLVFGRGTYRVEAPFIIEAVHQQVVPAPFEGYLDSVEVELGDTVAAGDVLATLDTAALRASLAEQRAARLGHLKQADLARRDDKPVEVQIAQAKADQAQARIGWLEHQLEQASIVSPIAGVVVKGDLQRQLGAPVSKGDTLFEIAPLDALRAVLHVDDKRIHAVAPDAAGELAAASHPGVHLPFAVERIDPIAQVVQDRNVFAVRVRLLESRPWVRPGIEGLAKVDAGERSYLWIWTHDAVDWLRMKLWW